MLNYKEIHMKNAIEMFFRIIMCAGFGFAACIVAGTVAALNSAPPAVMIWVMLGSFAFGAYAGAMRK